MNVLFAARTNWGKSWASQAFVERNAPEYDRVLIADYKGEYTGLVESELAADWPVGTEELDVGPDWWSRMIGLNEGVRLRRDGITDGDWREILADVSRAARDVSESVFLVIDEAHFVAPQRPAYPEEIKGLATTGDGEGVSVVWISQRLTELDETIIAQAGASMIGGFTSDQDLRKIRGVTEYPIEVHNDQLDREISGLPEELHAEEGPIPVRRFTDDDGATIGSEWIYSEGSDLSREDTREWDMTATHYGGDRNRVMRP
jgi:hypothetical protein